MNDIIDLSAVANEQPVELKIHPDGTECKIRITNIIQGRNKNDVPYIMPWFEDPDDVYVEDFSHYLELPSKDDQPKARMKKVALLQSFATCFGLDLFAPNYDLEEAKGATGWVILGIGKNQDGSACNKPKKYLRGEIA